MKTVTVTVTKSYYKTTEVEVDIPSHIKEGGIYDYLYELENKTCQFSDALADASLNSEGDVELEADLL